VSPTTWAVDTDHPVRLGNHLRDQSGNLLVRDDGRVTVPNGLAPGEDPELVVVCYPPPDPGTYVLEIDARSFASIEDDNGPVRRSATKYQLLPCRSAEWPGKSR